MHLIKYAFPNIFNSTRSSILTASHLLGRDAIKIYSVSQCSGPVCLKTTMPEHLPGHYLLHSRSAHS